MKKSRRIKRKAVSDILWHTVGVMSYCTNQVSEILLRESGTPVHRTSALRGALTEKEFEAIHTQVRNISRCLENLRKIAKHLEKGTRETQ